MCHKLTPSRLSLYEPEIIVSIAPREAYSVRVCNVERALRRFCIFLVPPLKSGGEKSGRFTSMP